jgi:hypothetical protein
MNDAIEIFKQIIADTEDLVRTGDNELYRARMVANCYDAEEFIKKHS